MTPELWQRLKLLYHAALDLPESARAQFVSEACGNDAELRGELMALLSANGHKRGSDETTPVQDLRQFLEQQPDGLFAPGELVLDRFRIIRLLGVGGMGEVYEAMDLELGRVALKTIRADLAGSPDLLTRFKKEVQFARAVSGPHICRIYDLFLDRQPGKTRSRALLTMEYLDGVTLAEKLLQTGSLPWGEARSTALEICKGLQAIHEAGIVHRDLKTRNIMLVSRNGSTRAVLMDFGLAREYAGAANATSIDLTNPGAIVGTPDYMAPEQFEGGQVSPATDIYAFGVVLYQLLTGEHPFAAATPIAAAVQRARRLKPPSSIQPKLPRRWDAIVAKCLEFKAEDRFQSADEVERELKLLQLGSVQSIVAHATSFFRKFRAISALKLAFAILLACILIAGTALAVWRFYPRKQPFASTSIEQITDSGDISAMALSPDGKTLAEVRSTRGQHAVWIQNVSTQRDVRILPPTTLNYGSLIFSSDGDQLYFVRQDGYSPRTFNLYRVSVLGGEPDLSLRNVGDKVALSSIQSRFAYIRSENDASEVHVISMSDREDRIVFKAREQLSSPAWSPSGEVLAWLYLYPQFEVPSGIDLFTIKSEKSREILLPPHVLSSGVSVAGHSLSWLPSGRQLLLLTSKSYSGFTAPGRQIGILDIYSGDFRPLTNDLIDHSEQTLSADGKILATLLKQNYSEIGFYDPSQGTHRPSARLPRRMDSLMWFDEDQMLVDGAELGIVRGDTGEFKDLDLTGLPRTHESDLWGSDSLNTAPALCGDGQFILTGSFDKKDQLFIVNSQGQFMRTLIEVRAGNFFCKQESNLLYYSIDTTSDPAIWRVPLSGGNPQKVVALPALAPVVYSVDGKYAAWILTGAGSSTASIVDLGLGKLVRNIALANFVRDTLPHFTRDGKDLAFVQLGEEGYTIVGQPVDGSPPHQLAGWFKDQISDFGWSPSGKILAILSAHSSSNVAVISDESSKSSR